jgi:hypothetical protein
MTSSSNSITSPFFSSISSLNSVNNPFCRTDYWHKNDYYLYPYYGRQDTYVVRSEFAGKEKLPFFEGVYEIIKKRSSGWKLNLGTFDGLIASLLHFLSS